MLLDGTAYEAACMVHFLMPVQTYEEVDTVDVPSLYIRILSDSNLYSFRFFLLWGHAQS